MEELQNLTPLYNKEFYLAYLCGEDVELPIPDGNTEHYLAYLCGMDVPIPDPLYTKEFYLAYKCGMDVELPEPGPYRIDQYLAKWCGMDVEVPEPMYRIEYWLAQLANSGELKTVSGNPISVSDALARPAESLVIEILPQQDLHGYGRRSCRRRGAALGERSRYQVLRRFRAARRAVGQPQGHDHLESADDVVRLQA